MEKVELKVNVINQLKLLRQSTFKDILCFLDEDIQNAQRAKATEVRILVDRTDKIVTIENNGKILDNPQALFSIADSEWDDDIKEQENPFGMGFFSNITVSSFIQVHSGNKMITFDVEKMINTNDTEINVEYVNESYDGFKLILKNFNFDIARSWDIEERVVILGKYIHELDVYYNGEIQEKKDLTSGDDSLFQFAIDNNKDFEGWIALGNNYSWNDNINIFYKGRLVSKLEGIPYLKGDIHVSDRTLNLTSPDRKNIIKDEKLNDFREMLKLYIEDFCSAVLLDNEDGIDEFTSCIGHYVDKDKVKNLVKFMTFQCDKNDDMKYLKGLALAKKNGKNINTFSQYELFLNEKSSIQQEEHFEEIEVQTHINNLPDAANGVVRHASSGSYSEGYIEVPHIDDKDLVEKYGTAIVGNNEPVFYIKFDEVEKYEYKLNVAKHYKLKIIVSRNDIETSILKNMKNTDKVLHISELDEKVSLTGSITNTELSNKERRAMMIFNLISTILGFNYNLFAIGNLMVTKNIKVESINVDETIIEDTIVVLKDEESKKIYIDRSILNGSMLSEDLNTTLTISDYQFVLANFKEITFQISELGFMGRDICEETLLNALGCCNQ